ncbi:MAG: acetyl-CoA carboxylase biotin carboxyl carrier protein [Candidatus Eremiobacteraeota bacterium]|nr:acetyl-CoA carboxylase biotin carboxyl carrier protein [Candidatus Eremiobacteraeota bacterium]MCW5870001.1 acetyl-CoA carboxylase biotin carboxyl carrier protein [Candidatus Eremiobacteraeota bacterium]
MQEPVELARELARIARENQLAEIEYREENTVLRLIFEPKKKFVQAAAVAAVPPPSTTVVLEEVAVATLPTAPAGLTINSPLAGVFYRAPRPNSPPFVEAGQQVATGQTLCIVEAMKLMNEITAEAPLKVLRVLVENGQVVEAGQALFEYEAR